MTLSVVITTRNESANIANCIRAFDGFRGDVEVIVVDNGSTDDTKGIAASLGAKVLDKGPERSAQRNLGWRTAVAPWVVILDADMILPRETIEEMLACPSRSGVAAYWIPEVRTGEGIRVKARNFERSFYDGTCIDALRLFSKEILEKTGGYDENLIAGPEDWELDIRVLETGAKCEVLKISPWYRFVGVFVEKGKWKRLLRHPILACVMYFERFAVGLVYLRNKGATERVCEAKGAQ